MAADEQAWNWPGSKPTPEWQVYTGPDEPTHVFYSPEEVRAFLDTLRVGESWDPTTGIQEFHIRIHKVVRHDEPRISVRTITTAPEPPRTSDTPKAASPPSGDFLDKVVRERAAQSDKSRKKILSIIAKADREPKKKKGKKR